MLLKLGVKDTLDQDLEVFGALDKFVKCLYQLICSS